MSKDFIIFTQSAQNQMDGTEHFYIQWQFKLISLNLQCKMVLIVILRVEALLTF